MSYFLDNKPLILTDVIDSSFLPITPSYTCYLSHFDSFVVCCDIITKISNGGLILTIRGWFVEGFLECHWSSGFIRFYWWVIVKMLLGIHIGNFLKEKHHLLYFFCSLFWGIEADITSISSGSISESSL